MTIDTALYQRIRWLYNEGHSRRKIAGMLNCSRKTVRKYCQGEIVHGAKQTAEESSSSIPFSLESEILKMLQEDKEIPRKQRRTAKAIWLELKKKGFEIGESTVRRYVHALITKTPDAFVPLSFEPGEAMQVDWGDMKAWIDGVNTPVSAFVTILPYSYGMHSSVFPDKQNAAFFTGHVKAFEFYCGVPKRCIYDNLRSAVASGSGTNAVKQEEFMKLEAHYGFRSDFCNAAAGWEKGGIENAVAILRRIAFTPMPRVKDFAQLQRHVDACCLEYIETHKIRYRANSIKEMLSEERKYLSPLPLTPMDTAKTVTALVGSDLTVLFEGTRYSVPLKFVGEKVTLKISPFSLAVWHKGEEIYTHTRALKKGDHQYVTEHYLELMSRKPRSAMNAVPLKKGIMPEEFKEFLKHCRAEDKEEQLLQIMLLARTVAPDDLLWAVEKAVQSGSPTHQLVTFFLGIATGESEIKPCIKIEHHDLKEYDRLLRGDKDEF